MARTLAERMLGAARLDASVYEEVEADRSGTMQAALVVVIVALCGAIGNYYQAGSRGALAAVISAFLGWALWAAVTYVVGTMVFKGTATWGELLRTLGFAQSPGVLALLGTIPFLGRLVVFVVAIWQLVAGIVAIRQALDVDTGTAVATAIIAAVAVMVAAMAVAFVLLGTLLIGGALLG